MNERELQRLLKRLALLSAPFSLALAGAACGGTALEGDSGGAAGRYAEGGASNGGAGSSGAGASTGGAGASGAGGSIACNGTATVVNCGSSQVTMPKSCVSEAMAQVGKALPSATCQAICTYGSVLSCAVSAVDSQQLTVSCTSGCFTGRRPAGLSAPLAFDGSALGSYFASIACLEAASVDAFRILRDELRAHGAPKKLVRAAARAARDEVRHTRATSALARRFGARLASLSVPRTALRSLEVMAIENAVEGCVRETYGALLATWQARTAGDPVVRAAMMRIARDETRHAALSWNVGRWLETRLDTQAKRQVSLAKRAAAQELVNSTRSEPEAPFADVVGLPTRAQASQLAREMQRTLWS